MRAINLPAILAISPARQQVYEGPPGPAVGPRLFGGQAIAQALLAACAEEDAERLPHSLHAHFLKAGSATDPVEYEVTNLTEGRSFATRRVDGWQDGRMIFTMVASFHAPETGFSHALAPPYDLDVEAALTALRNWREGNPETAALPMIDRMQNRPIQIVPLEPQAMLGGQASEPRAGMWMRMREPSGGDRLMQRALLAYASDMMFLRNAMLPHPIQPGTARIQAASLDHAIWFHEDPDFDKWHLYATDSPWTGNARGLNRGHFFDEQGRLIATVTQESLMRPK